MTSVTWNRTRRYVNCLGMQGVIIFSKNYRVLISRWQMPLPSISMERKLGRVEFQIDESIIAEVTELPRDREKWFKTIVTKHVEFRSYLKPEHRGLIWNHF
jgi:hypothetical protein